MTTQTIQILQLLTFATIILTSITIFLKTHKYFTLSKYPGFKYLSKTFFYLTLSTILEIAQTFLTIKIQTYTITPTISILQHYFFTLSIFYLIYSLNWKTSKTKNKKTNTTTIHILAILLTTTTHISNFELTNLILTILLIYTTTIFHKKYKTQTKTKTQNHQFQLYYISLLIITLTTILKIISSLIQIIKPLTYILTIGSFLLLLYITTKKQKTK